MKLSQIARRRIALLLVTVMLSEILFPAISLALSSGPIQPEFSSFEHVNATEMVDLFSGDFSYNIPLLNVDGPHGGYPINLFYKSPLGMEQEASMVGLGWNIGVGNINRQLRGIPDDFSGELVETINDRKVNVSASVGVGAGLDETEVFGIPLGGEIGVNASLLYNNYKGLGFGFGYRFGLGKNAQLNADAQFSTFEGSTIGVGASMADENMSLGLKYTASSNGTDPNISASNGLTIEKNYEIEGKMGSVESRTSSSFSLLPQASNFTPSYDLSYNGISANLSMAAGGDLFGVSSAVRVMGSFREQHLNKESRRSLRPSIGYMYSDLLERRFNALGDFNRVNFGELNRSHQNMYASYNTEDYFYFTGQGTGGVFKLYRNDFGINYDPVTLGETFGLDISGEIEFGNLLGVGVDAGVLYDRHESDGRALKDRINDIEDYDFRSKELGDLYEPYFFKVVGEKTAYSLDNKDPYYRDISTLSKDNPIRFNINKQRVAREGFRSELLSGEKYTPSFKVQGEIFGNRIPRGRLIQHMTNDELYFVHNDELDSVKAQVAFPYFGNVYKVDSAVLGIPFGGYQLSSFNREVYSFENDDDQINQQIAGFKVLENNGHTYNYTLPVYNYSTSNYTFSIEKENGNSCNGGTERKRTFDYESGGRINYSEVGEVGNPRMYREERIPTYASSYLLTSIIGDNYISNKTATPDNEDYGHWVKFRYFQVNDAGKPYSWKMPYKGAQVNEGLLSNENDDVATFSHGKRDQFLPASIETASHISYFFYSTREDAVSAHVDPLELDGENDIVSLTDDSFQSSYQLDSIQLHVKTSYVTVGGALSSEKLKTVHFRYHENSSSLCQNVENSEGNGGKLTLEKVWITNFGSKRGSLSPYKFKYYGIDVDPSLNKNYALNQQDRWGVYTDRDACESKYFSYTEQGEATDVYGEDLEKRQADYVKAWHISAIELPSGAKIELDIGRDHYSHVQDKVANQMFRITGFRTNDNFDLPLETDNAIERKVYFELEEPIDASDPNANQLLERYFEHLHVGDNGERQIYYKFKAAMLDNEAYELVEGILYIDDVNEPYGFGDESNGQYTHGWFQVKSYPDQFRGHHRHPMVVRNWQYLKKNLRFLLTPDINDIRSGADAVDYIHKSVNNFFRTITGFYSRCIGEGYGLKVESNSAVVRLNSPDLKKFGGGVRVNKVVLNNLWDVSGQEDLLPSYGNVYLYEKYDDQREDWISTGVASNEPSIGGEESALRNWEKFEETVRLGANLSRLQKTPILESYLPGASIGYSEVRVRSLASQYKYLNFQNADDQVLAEYDGSTGHFPNINRSDYEEINSTGEVLNEFYTCKDFPVTFRKTAFDKKESPFKLPVFGLVHVEIENFAGSQGFTVELNDMHGKHKKNSNYAQAKNGSFLPNPVSSTEYIYFEEETVTGNGRNGIKNSRRLKNEVPIIVDYKPDIHEPTGSQPNYEDQLTSIGELGVSRTVSSDIASVDHTSFDLGVLFNADLFIAPIIPPITLMGTTVLPKVKMYNSRVNTSSTTKVINRSGILKEVIVSDGQSVIRTSNEVFDPFTGNAVLTKTQNEFNNDIYNYNAPAHLTYDRMSAAYQNYGFEFEVDFPDAFELDCDFLHWFQDTDNLKEILVKGDVLLTHGINPFTRPRKAVYMGYIGDQLYFDFNYGNISGFSQGGFQVVDKFDSEADPDPERIYFKIIESGHANQLDRTTLQLTTLNEHPLKSIEDSTEDIENTGSCIVTVTENVDIYQFPNVLDAKYTRYSDVHTNHFIEDYCTTEDTTVQQETTENSSLIDLCVYVNPFLNGKNDCYDVKSSYQYQDNRLYLASVDPSENLISQYDEQGVYNSKVALFDEELDIYLPNNEDLGWLETTRITHKTKDLLAGETKDANGVYTAQLYGYQDIVEVSNIDGERCPLNKPKITANFKNAKYFECGFSSFESYEIYDLISDYENLTHIDINTRPQSHYRIYDADFVCFDPGGDVKLITDYNYDELTTDAKVQVVQMNNPASQEFGSYFSSKGMTGDWCVESDNGEFGRAKFDTTHSVLTISGIECQDCSVGNQAHHASVIFQYKDIDIPSAWKRSRSDNEFPLYLGISIDDQRAHSGKKSLKINSGSPKDDLLQRCLKPEIGKEYESSCWIYFDTDDYDRNSAFVEVVDYTSENVIGQLKPVGKKVEGWQLFKGNFVFDGVENGHNCNTPEGNTNGVYYFDFGLLMFKIGGVDINIDDLRVYPAEAQGECYVYDEYDRVEYVLDDNNYYTKYVYDENGQLVGIIKETEEGLRTIEENRIHVKEQ